MGYKEGCKLFELGKYMEAVQEFTLAIAAKDNIELSYRERARCYLRAGEFNAAYVRFDECVGLGVEVDFCLSMMGRIKANYGEYNEAIKVMRKVPKTANNLINLATTYILQHKHDGVTYALDEAKRVLDSICLDGLSNNLACRLNLTFGHLNQAFKIFGLAESYYQQALGYADDNFLEASIQNDLGSLFIETKNYNKALEHLNKALAISLHTDTICEGFTHKWLGILKLKTANSEDDLKDAVCILEKSAKILRDRQVYKELAAVNFYLGEINREKLGLSDLAKNRDFDAALKYYTAGTIYENLAKEVEKCNEEDYCYSMCGNGSDD